MPLARSPGESVPIGDCLCGVPVFGERGQVRKFLREPKGSCRAQDEEFILINNVFNKIFGTANEREVKKLMPRVERINALEPEISKLTDEQLSAKTLEFRGIVQERLESVPDDFSTDAAEMEKERSRVIAEDRKSVV